MTPAEILLSGVVGVMGSGSIWNWLSSRGKERVDLVKVAQEAASSVIGELRAELTAARDEMAELREELSALSTHIISLENVIRDAGLPIPPRPGRKA